MALGTVSGEKHAKVKLDQFAERSLCHANQMLRMLWDDDGRDGGGAYTNVNGRKFTTAPKQPKQMDLICMW